MNPHNKRLLQLVEIAIGELRDVQDGCCDADWAVDTVASIATRARMWLDHEIARDEVRHGQE